jgi:hypothetical protein
MQLLTKRYLFNRKDIFSASTKRLWIQAQDCVWDSIHRRWDVTFPSAVGYLEPITHSGAAYWHPSFRKACSSIRSKVIKKMRNIGYSTEIISEMKLSSGISSKKVILNKYWAHSSGQFKKHGLLKARTQSPCFSYPGLSRAFNSAGSADLSSFGGVSAGCGARFTVLVACLWTGENAAGLFANCCSHRLPMTILHKINVVAFVI